MGMSRRIKTRLLAAALMLAATGAQAAAGLDLAGAVHALCAEHGEIIHVGATESRAIETDRVQTPSAPPEHQHCGLLVALTAPAVSGHWSEVAIRVPDVASDARQVHVGVAENILRLAPKNSPPASRS